MIRAKRARKLTPPNFPSGGGEMGARIRAFNWPSTPLGPIVGWPQSLRTVVNILLSSRYAMWMAWGPELTFLCNDAYRPTLGIKDPWALGAPATRVWAEIWPDIGPRIETVLATGRATYDEGLLLILERSGFREETYHTFSYSPLQDDAGQTAGMLCVVTEETERLISERRVETLREITSVLASTKSEDEVTEALQLYLGKNDKDLPYSLTYLYDEEGRASLVCSCGLDPHHPLAASMLEPGMNSPWPASDTLKDPYVRQINLSGRSGAAVPICGFWNVPVGQAIVVPLKQAAQDRPAGFLAFGTNPYCRFNSVYGGFIDLLAGQIAAAFSNAHSYEAERRRAEALAEIDRAKTTFFTNISHEFRTPLTLMLGPLEALLARRDELPPEDRAQLESAYRNSLRLLKLVNSLLDFSRIETGRINASFEPADLASITADLASHFRSAMEAAGLQFRVACPPLSQLVYIDPEMWEKIVLNLLSNAFKFTFEGTVSVELEQHDGHAVLVVSDTGVGIPETELPHIFERFHRVEGAKGRTYEGSGIGLALIQELVKLHGGTVEASSRIGEGSRFTVTVPFGRAHLPRESIGRQASTPSSVMSQRAEAFTGEAIMWLSRDPLANSQADSRKRPPSAYAKSRILVADDNADMRSYIARVLAEDHEVVTVPDGETALGAVRANPPDLIVSDVMMPQLDGIGLVRQIRADPAISSLPIIFLSARAGEESRVEGLEHGADDYLIKPFSARELAARVNTHLELARTRKLTEQVLRRNNQELEAIVRERTLGLEEAKAVLASELDVVRQLHHVSTDLLETPDLDAVFEQIVDAAKAAVQSDFASVQMLHPERGSGGEFKLESSRGFTDRAKTFWDWVNASKTTSCGLALRTGKRAVITNVNACEPLTGTVDLEVFRETGIVSMQTTPLLSGSGSLLGALSTRWRTPHVLTDREERALDILARLAADIIERSLAEEELRESLAEKDALLKEVHHRVKNNLQVITSLLNLQAGQTTDSKALAMFDEARNRVASIAFIHELLYRSGSFAAVDIAAYTHQLVPTLVRLYGLEQRIVAEVHAEPVSLDLERAVSFGLLLNELVSNSCKHAFPDHHRGKLTVTLSVKEEHIVLRVADTGIGLPAALLDDGRASSLGVQLTRTLARRLGGLMSANSGPGAMIELRIPIEALPEDSE